MISDVRPLVAPEATDAIRLLCEASAWSERFGQRIWRQDEFELASYEAWASEGRLFGGFEGNRLAACMRVDRADPVHWPDDPPGEALYVHKVVVARESAGRGWPGRLIEVAIMLATHAGARFVRLDTAPREKLVDLYRRLGFKTVDDAPGWFAGRELVRMELRCGETCNNP